MRGQVAVVTGGTSGIGQVAAEQLAGMGLRIILVARDPARAESTLARLRQAGPDLDHSAVRADLASVRETAEAARRISGSEERIDLLVNNAGAMFNQRTLTAEGLETTFALNHMSYFALTLGLLGPLKAASAARIVSTASAAHLGATLDISDLQSANGYSGFRAYGRSKLANILFTRALARRLSGGSVTANCLHPGFVATRFGDASGGWAQAVMPLAKLFAISPQKGADTIVYLSASPDVAGASGNYYVDRKIRTPSAAAQDEALGERLWSESETLLTTLAG